jgi:hypothetical protein
VDEYLLRLLHGGHIIRSHTYDPSADEDWRNAEGDGR